MATDFGSAMQRPTIIGLYGIPGSGKTSAKNQLEELLGKDGFAFYDGSDKIDKVVPDGLDDFKALSNVEKHFYRELAIDQIEKECTSSGSTGLVTGHCMFWPEGAEFGEWIVTEKDWTTYSLIVYLDVPAEVIAQRCQNDTRTRAFASVDHLRTWQREEKRRLRREC